MRVDDVGECGSDCLVARGIENDPASTTSSESERRLALHRDVRTQDDWQ